MKKEEREEIIIQTKKSYASLSPTPCKALGGELVHFNRYGITHLLRKGRKYRGVEELKRRLALLPYVKETLNTEPGAIHRKDVLGDSIADFWAIEHTGDNMIIRVVVRKMNNGRLHFFSIMDKSKPP